MAKLPDGWPETLAPYHAYEINDFVKSSKDEWVATCPFCDGEGKFSVNGAKGVWRCFVCNEGSESGEVIRGGNVYTFLTKVWQNSSVDEEKLAELASDRKSLSTAHLKRWGVRWCELINRWVIPAYGGNGNLNQLYRYTPLKRKGDWVMDVLPTPGLSEDSERIGLFRADGYDESKPSVTLCEGVWDGVATSEVMSKITPEGALTGDESKSLLRTINVLAVPGCNNFLSSWASYFAGKDVTLLFDHDHPKVNRGVTRPPAGYDGMRRVADLLAKSDEPPRSLRFVDWADGKEFSPDLPDGFDVRDHLSQAGTVNGRRKLFTELLTKVKPIPADWVKGRSEESIKSGSLELEPLECASYEQLVECYKQYMHWTDGPDCALSVMLASILSTPSKGDQLWVLVLGPPSSGKSFLSMALGAARRYVKPISTFRGLHTGQKGGKDSKEGDDQSLIAKLKGKTLLVKDSDTILKMPDRARVLSELRDGYDSVMQTDYRNGVNNDYQGHKFTAVFCGTEDSREIDESGLGARFLIVEIAKNVSVHTERSASWAAALSMIDECDHDEGGASAVIEDDRVVRVKRTTIGYVNHLREGGEELRRKVSFPHEAAAVCQTLAEYVSFARAKPPKNPYGAAQRELSPRLTKQMIKLAKMLAVVLNHNEVVPDGEVMRRVKKVALSTADGRTTEVLDALFSTEGDGDDPMEGMELGDVAVRLQSKEESVAEYLTFLQKIGVVEQFTHKNKSLRITHTARRRWRPTERMAGLYREVMGRAVGNPSAEGPDEKPARSALAERLARRLRGSS